MSELVVERRSIPKWNLPVFEFVEPTPSDYFIHWLFRHRCIMCKQSAIEINEIKPRSRSKLAIMDWRNRVTLCASCHRNYHKNGVTETKMEDMKKAREDFLISIDRKEYV